MEQLDLFQSVLEEHQPKFNVLDKVKVLLIPEEIDSELHNYRKYYEPHVLNKVGEITNILVNEKNVATYEVDIYGSKYYLLEQELRWLG